MSGPSVRYAHTRDDGAVAFWTNGAGIPLLHLPWLPWGHIQLELGNTDFRAWYDHLADFSQLIRYDGRGAGLSDRTTSNLGLETQVADIEAVVDHLRIDRFAVFAALNMGPAAFAYASRHPERVSHLILWCTYANAAEYSRGPAVNAIRSLLESDWTLYTETGAHAFVGWAAGDSAHEVARIMRESSTRELTQKFYNDISAVDLETDLAELQVPTLVLHPRGFPLIDLDHVRRLVSAIPDARLELFEGDSLSPMRSGNFEAVLDAVRTFIGASRPLSMEAVDLEPAMAPEDSSLSGRELEVLRLLAKGLSNRDIAEVLVLSPRTVERHIANIYGKLGLSNRAQAAAHAINNHIV